MKGDIVMNKLIDYVKDNRKLNEFIVKNRDLIIKVAAAFVVVVVAFLIFSIKGGGEEEILAEESVADTQTAAAAIFVDVGGEVNNPLVAELEEGSRIEDAIEAAGGLTDKADMTNINRAAFVQDGEKIYIPAAADISSGESEAASGSSDTGSSYAASYSDGKININTADLEQLQELSGVGPVTAQKIIDYREQNGNFTAIEDIKNVSGIGDKTYEKLKDSIKVW